MSNCSFFSMVCWVTYPRSPKVPSSVVVKRRPYFRKWSSCSRSVSDRAPSKKVGSMSCFCSVEPKKSIGAIPTPPPTNRGRTFVFVGIVNAFPNGSRRFIVSPRR